MLGLARIARDVERAPPGLGLGVVAGASMSRRRAPMGACIARLDFPCPCPRARRSEQTRGSRHTAYYFFGVAAFLARARRLSSSAAPQTTRARGLAPGVDPLGRRQELPETRITQENSSPHHDSDEQRHDEDRLPGANVRGDRTPEVSGEEDGSENARRRHEVENDAGELDDTDGPRGRGRVALRPLREERPGLDDLERRARKESEQRKTGQEPASAGHASTCLRRMRCQRSAFKKRRICAGAP